MLDALNAVGFVPGAKLGSQGGEEFLLEVVHAATVQAGGFGVFPNGQAVDKAALEQVVIGGEGGFQTGIEKIS